MSRTEKYTIKDAVGYYWKLYRTRLDEISVFLGESAKVDNSAETFLSYYKYISEMLDTSCYEGDENTRKLFVILYLTIQFQQVLDGEISTRDRLLIPVITFIGDTRHSYEEEESATAVKPMNFVGLISVIRSLGSLIDADSIEQFISSEDDSTGYSSSSTEEYDRSVIGDKTDSGDT